MENKTDKINICVVGGGAAGMAAAIWAASENTNVYILEAEEITGKKILATGNGRCNLANAVLSSDKYNCEDKSFVECVLDDFDEKDTVDFFNRMGIAVKNKNDYFYPESMQASNVRESMTGILRLKGVNIFTNCKAEEIKVMENGDFNIFCSDMKSEKKVMYTADKVIVALGSKAGIHNYYYENFRNSIVNLKIGFREYLPALCGIKVGRTDTFFKNVSGVRTEIEAYSIIEGISSESIRGELQLTEYGLSGIVIFQLSSKISRALFQKKKCKVVVDFLPDYNENTLAEFLTRQEFYEKKSILDLFSGVLNKKLVTELIKMYSENVNKDIKAFTKGCSKMDLEDIIHYIKNVSFEIKGTKDYINAQVCSGGFDVSEIDRETMESKVIKNLYFAGECIDVDGQCGGYNLQWAWATGYLAGKSASSRKDAQKWRIGVKKDSERALFSHSYLLLSEGK